jgi:hypothetical protein
MGAISRRIMDFVRSPKGQQLIEQVKDQTQKPENRRRLEELRTRFMKKR